MATAMTLALENEKIAKKKARFEADAQRTFKVKNKMSDTLKRSFTRRARPAADGAAEGDADDRGSFLSRFMRLSASEPRGHDDAAGADPDLPKKKPCSKRVVGMASSLLGSLGFQTLMYFIFVLIFQRLANAIRSDEEFYVNQRIQDDFIDEHFDSSHNTFESVRRIADVYEWGTHVLWPGLFWRVEPCAPGA